MTNTNPVKIFIAYAAADSSYLDNFKKHFSPQERSAKVSIWYDGEVTGGEDLEAARKGALESAQIVLLLLSSDALASDDFYDEAIQAALQRHHAKTTRVVPIIMRPCNWTQHSGLSKLKPLPADGSAISMAANVDDAYTKVSNEVLKIADSFRQNNPAPINTRPTGIDNVTPSTTAPSPKTNKLWWAVGIGALLLAVGLFFILRSGKGKGGGDAQHFERLMKNVAAYYNAGVYESAKRYLDTAQTIYPNDAKVKEWRSKLKNH